MRFFRGFSLPLALHHPIVMYPNFTHIYNSMRRTMWYGLFQKKIKNGFKSQR